MRAINLVLRGLIAAASLGMLACALILLSKAGGNILGSMQASFAHDSGRSISLIMKAIDECLFGIILILMGAKVAASFVLPEEAAKTFPRWMQPSSIADLKTTFCQAVLVYLIVDFATDMAVLDVKSDVAYLVLPACVLLIALALKLMPHSAAH
ncbi:MULTISPECIES: YqhA family protein [unclassified Bosea (in: a-proteobacteria)]|uniref:YqhA family protein n=1 Tax=unclassified Bosea (in: a-proteobacteria) TaxID=2653178 RepID=UPI0009572CC2|nr:MULTISPECIES: YqhA family protein [unclassified Bosea (in: a-proteobacteria)]TAJ30897.1 MAG: hypothetical protein EPO59_09715 [Bosea sp. (in: a-proteobacteria)]SIQ21865.1 Uncharacterized protein family, UPF0114 [Bosea sp. TND4EK4]